jgi:ubiquitin-protein ligase
MLGERSSSGIFFSYSIHFQSISGFEYSFNLRFSEEFPSSSPKVQEWEDRHVT